MGKQLIIIVVLFFTAASAAAAASYPADLGGRTALLVLPIEAKGAGGDRGAMADDYLVEAFTGLSRFTIIER